MLNAAGPVWPGRAGDGAGTFGDRSNTGEAATGRVPGVGAGPERCMPLRSETEPTPGGCPSHACRWSGEAAARGGRGPGQAAAWPLSGPNGKESGRRPGCRCGQGRHKAGVGIGKRGRDVDGLRACVLWDYVMKQVGIHAPALNRICVLSDPGKLLTRIHSFPRTLRTLHPPPLDIKGKDVLLGLISSGPA